MNWDLLEAMTEAHIEVIMERARNFTQAKPPSDNGPQFIAKDFKEFIRIPGMTTSGTSPYYPNRTEIERWRKSLLRECIRQGRHCRETMRRILWRAMTNITTTSG